MLTKDDLVAIENIIEKDSKPVKRELKKMRKDLNIVITRFDRDIVETKRRVNRIEDRLILPPMPAN